MKAPQNMPARFQRYTSEQASADEKESFIELVRSREAVQEEFVRAGIERRGALLIFGFVGESLAGVAALKVPSKSYRSGLSRPQKSGYPLPQQHFPFELGYVAVAQDHEGRGLGTDLVREVVEVSGGKGLFATTSNVGMLEHILPRFGFKRVGQSWAGQQSSEPQITYNLHLLVRHAKN